jgi:hypothetical protein
MQQANKGIAAIFVFFVSAPFCLTVGMCLGTAPNGYSPVGRTDVARGAASEASKPLGTGLI